MTIVQRSLPKETDQGNVTPDQLSETYAAFDPIRRKINQSKEAKKIAVKKY